MPIAVEDRQFVAVQIPEAELPKPPPSPPAKLWRSSKIHARGPSVNGSADASSKPAPETNAPTQHIHTPTPEVIMTEDMDKVSDAQAEIAAQPQAGEIASSVPNAIEDMPATLNSSSVAVGTPAQPTGGMTAMDLVRQMQRSSVGNSTSPRSPELGKKFGQPAHVPNLFNTPFTPTFIEHAQFSPRMDIAQQKRSPSFHNASLTSSAVFQDQLNRQQQEIQQRSSPQLPVPPTPSWDTFGQTPTGMDSMLRAFENNARTPSPYASGHSQVNGRSPQPRYTSNPPPFGIIGQARPLSRGAPPNGQG